MNCTQAMSALVTALENGAPIGDDVREHLRDCERCRAWVDAAGQLELNESAAPRVDESALHAEVQRRHRAKLAMRFAFALLAWIALLATPLLHQQGFGFGLPELAIIGVLVVFIAFAPGIVLFLIASKMAKRRGKPLYRRLNDRVWLGVCAGLEEALGYDRNLLRALFVLLVFGKGIGLGVYIVFALATPVHPSDRELFWRWRVLRWIRSL